MSTPFVPQEGTQHQTSMRVVGGGGRWARKVWYKFSRRYFLMLYPLLLQQELPERGEPTKSRNRWLLFPRGLSPRIVIRLSFSSRPPRRDRAAYTELMYPKGFFAGYLRMSFWKALLVTSAVLPSVIGRCTTPWCIFLRVFLWHFEKFFFQRGTSFSSFCSQTRFSCILQQQLFTFRESNTRISFLF